MADDDAYVGGPFYRVCADPQRVAVLDYIVTYEGLPVSVESVMEATGFTQEVVEDHLSVLQAAELVTQVEADTYRFSQSESAELFESFHTSLYDSRMGDIIDAIEDEE